MEKMSISILLADDHRIIRDGLRSLLSTMPEMQVVGEAENGRQALRIARKHNPDLVIMDISMPDLNGIEATRQILAESPGTKVLALSMHSDRQFVIQMFRAGVSGYLLKNGAFEELVLAIDTVRKNETYLSPKIASVLVKDLLETTEDNSASSVLTPRRERSCS